MEIIKSFLFFLIGFVAAFIFEKTTKKWALWDKKIGWQVHHSIIGLILIVASLFLKEKATEFISAGIGVIFQHTISDGFVFIRKWK